MPRPPRSARRVSPRLRMGRSPSGNRLRRSPGDCSGKGGPAWRPPIRRRGETRRADRGGRGMKNRPGEYPWSAQGVGPRTGLATAKIMAITEEVRVAGDATRRRRVRGSRARARPRVRGSPAAPLRTRTLTGAAQGVRAAGHAPRPLVGDGVSATDRSLDDLVQVACARVVKSVDGFDPAPRQAVHRLRRADDLGELRVTSATTCGTSPARGLQELTMGVAAPPRPWARSWDFPTPTEVAADLGRSVEDISRR